MSALMYEVTNNEKEMQFEVKAGNEKATLTYRFYKNDIVLMHTIVPEVLAGNGIGSLLAEGAFDYAYKHKKPVIVYCPFVAEFLKKHTEYRTQLDPEYLQSQL